MVVPTVHKFEPPMIKGKEIKKIKISDAMDMWESFFNPYSSIYATVVDPAAAVMP